MVVDERVCLVEAQLQHPLVNSPLDAVVEVYRPPDEVALVDDHFVDGNEVGFSWCHGLIQGARRAHTGLPFAQACTLMLELVLNLKLAYVLKVQSVPATTGLECVLEQLGVVPVVAEKREYLLIPVRLAFPFLQVNIVRVAWIIHRTLHQRLLYHRYSTRCGHCSRFWLFV